MVRILVYADQTIRIGRTIYGTSLDKHEFIKSAELKSVTVCPKNVYYHNEWCIHFNAVDVNGTEYDIIKSSYEPAD